MHVVANPVQVPAEDAPSDPVATGPVNLGQARVGQAGNLARDRCHRDELGVVVDHLVVDLVGHQEQAVPARDARDFRQGIARVNRPAGIVRVDDHDRPGAIVDEGFHRGEIGCELVLRRAGIVTDDSAVERHGSRPERIVRTRDEDLVSGIQQRP